MPKRKAKKDKVPENRCGSCDTNNPPERVICFYCDLIIHPPWKQKLIGQGIQ